MSRLVFPSEPLLNREYPLHDQYGEMLERGSRTFTGFVSNLKGKVAEMKVDLEKSDLLVMTSTLPQAQRNPDGISSASHRTARTFLCRSRPEPSRTLATS